jgi:lactate dehydrogenase-like 2-hydroxyacid dehydrogenase
LRGLYHVIDNILKPIVDIPMPKPSVLMIGPYPSWDLEPLEAAYEVYRLWEAGNPEGFVAENAATIRAIATRGELGAGADLIARLPQLEIISCYGVGTDAIDLAAARRRGIHVTNTPDVLTEDVADLALALMLAVARKLPQAESHVRSGAWARGNMELTTRMCGKRLGIVGMGRIGRAVARRAAGFDMRISYSGRSRHDENVYPYVESLEDLARQSDFLVATLAGGTATKGLIGAGVFAALGPSGYFINVARGSVADEPALLAALESGTIRGAGLDVFWNEPRIDPRFLALDNVVLQPHHGSGTVETRKAMGQLVRDNLAAHFAGRPLLTPVA